MSTSKEKTTEKNWEELVDKRKEIDKGTNDIGNQQRKWNWFQYKAIYLFILLLLASYLVECLNSIQFVSTTIFPGLLLEVQIKES